MEKRNAGKLEKNKSRQREGVEGEKQKEIDWGRGRKGRWWGKTVGKSAML